MSKRRLYPTNHTDQDVSRRPKRVIVPSSEEEWLQGPVYEWNWDAFLQDTTLTPIARPLPSVAAMVPPSSKPKLNMPLLQHLQPLMKIYAGSGAGTASTGTNTETKAASALEAIDDSSSSTLSRGQHARYLQLFSGSEPWNDHSRKEFRKLSRLVELEQQAYRQALEQFWNSHSNQYKIGLQHEQTSSYCMLHAQHYQTAYRETGIRYFGPCKQAISLQQVSKAAFGSARMSNTQVTLDSISSRIVHEPSENNRIVLGNDWESNVTVVPGLQESKMPRLLLLEKDSRAMHLAKQQGASIVTTLETLQTLLQVAGDELTHWMIPVTRENGMIVLDVPLPRPTTPRQCVTQGVTEGLYQALSTTTSRSPPEYTYSLLTLPSNSNNKSKSPLKVLVRIPQRLYTASSTAATIPTTTGNNSQPLFIHTQLEYFRTRGWEESTSLERACWMLYSILYNPQQQQQVTTRVAHVDPSSFKVLKWQHVSMAHALAAATVTTFNHNHILDPIHHLESLVYMLQATETCAVGKHLLVLSPSSTSVMVHSACSNNSETADETYCMDVEEQLKRADIVYTGAAALRQCARPWQWKEDRIPFTFPIKGDGQGHGRSAS